ncbi:MAG: single-stranded-DNA-specific exonuclease RecJ [Candidatus Cloacimonadales bacterium]
MDNVWEIGVELTLKQKKLRNQISCQLKCPRTIASLLIKKGLESMAEIEAFLNPTLSQLHDPYLFRDMEKAVARVLLAIENKEKITIYGDYDVDGTTSTALLYLGLTKLGAVIDYYIPHRMVDGYGLSISGLDQIKENGTTLIISVDCGINAIAEVDQINAYGMEIIITDHHNPKSVLPNALAIINAKVKDSSYPFATLAGVGVAYKLMVAIYMKLGIDTPENVSKYLDLVALGTIADIVPLEDENRVLSALGLNHLIEKNNIGLKSLIEFANLNQKTLTSADIVFGLAPRINAAGRMGSADIAVELLISTDEKQSNELAENIEHQNSLRQREDQKTYQDAIDIIDKKYKNIDETVLIVLSSDNWHQGVIGIVASKLVEQFNRPVIMISVKDGIGSGSGRSIPELDLFEALTDNEDDLISFGGHKYAVGLTIYQEYIDIFENKLADYIKTKPFSEHIQNSINIDSHLELYDINNNFLDWIERFSPFGAGNKRPVFYTEKVNVSTYPYIVGKNHLKLKVIKDGVDLDLIGYNLGDYLTSIKKNSCIDIAYSVEVNSFFKKKTIQGKLLDIKVNE